MSTPDYTASEEYYRKAIDLWPSNCGALSYLTELYLTLGNETMAVRTVESLCDRCGNEDESSDVEDALDAFGDSDFDAPDYDACYAESSGKSGVQEASISLPLIAGCVAGGALLLGAAGVSMRSKMLREARSKRAGKGGGHIYEKGSAMEMATVAIDDRGQMVSKGSVRPEFSDV